MTMITTLEVSSLITEGAFTTIGEFLAAHAQKAPLEQHISFGLSAQRYCRALGLTVLRLPGQPPRYPSEALTYVQNAKYSHWRSLSSTPPQQVGDLLSEMLGGRMEAGPFTYAEMEQHVLKNGHFHPLINSKDSPRSRMAKLCILLKRHSNTRLPNKTRLTISITSTRHRLYHIYQLT